MVVVEAVADFCQQAALAERAVTHGVAGINGRVAFTRFVVFFSNPVGRKQGIEAAGAAVCRQAAVPALIARYAGIDFEADIPAFAQQILGINGLRHNRAAGGTDAGRSRAGTFLHGGYFNQRRIEQETAIVVEKLGIGVGVVHFDINLILPHAAHGYPLRSAVAAAEADGRFVKQHVFHIG